MAGQTSDIGGLTLLDARRLTAGLAGHAAHGGPAARLPAAAEDVPDAVLGKLKYAWWDSIGHEHNLELCEKSVANGANGVFLFEGAYLKRLHG